MQKRHPAYLLIYSSYSVNGVSYSNLYKESMLVDCNLMYMGYVLAFSVHNLSSSSV